MQTIKDRPNRDKLCPAAETKINHIVIIDRQKQAVEATQF
jgi:hypothetical protein